MNNETLSLATRQRTAPITRAEVLHPLTALADDGRLRILELLAAEGELRGQDLMLKLDLSQPNLSRQIKPLVAARLVQERRAGDTNKLYKLNLAAIEDLCAKLPQLLSPDNAQANVMVAQTQALRQAALQGVAPEVQPFLDDHGRVLHFSTKLKEQQWVLAYLINKIAIDRTYNEREMTQLLDDWVSPEARSRRLYGVDAVTLRRALVEESSLRRTSDGAKYWREA
ncbi:MAG: metalloregulator ArsR/SmtB family transcription factor [Anaerolineae bacterium]|nr:metalloregulator ArsR/SmtB family transcription factor [Anaerolineae bacterium]